MVKKILTILLLVCYVYALDSFFEEGKRAKFFELIDNKVISFNFTFSDEEYIELNEKAQHPGNDFIQSVKKLVNDMKIAFGILPPNEEEENTQDPGPDPQEFKIKDASLVVEVNGEVHEFKKVTFSIGGSSSRNYGRLGYNIKIRDNKNLYGLSQFRIRPDAREATYLRSKLACDMHNRLGLTSISANYITLYINNIYFGMYILMEAPKLSWIEQRYGEKNTSNLYKCKSGGICLSVQTSAEQCENENEEVTDRSEWIKLLTAIDNAQSAEDIEDIFDVDQFLYEMAYEYLTGSWDRFLSSGHNYSMYKQPNGKWIMISYDYDADFGQDPANIEFGLVEKNPNKDFPSYTFGEYASKRFHIIDILIFKDPTRFLNILKNFVTNEFNPSVLFPRIDELKKFIKPYIIKDKTKDKDGNYPGLINKYGSDYTLEQWDANSEFTTISDEKINSSAYGLKYWILIRYRTVCKNYLFDCDSTYMDENYKYSVDKDVEGEIYNGIWDSVDFSLFGFGDYKVDDFEIPDSYLNQENENQANENQENKNQDQPTENAATISATTSNFFIFFFFFLFYVFVIN